MQATQTEINSNPVCLANIRACVEADLQAVDQLIIRELTSRIPLIEKIISHILQSGGKRLRPLLVILSARAFGYQNIEHHELAAIIEFVHTATLLHDDVIDESHLRRGRQTANALWGNEASVLVGDFLYSRAFQVLARRANIPVMKVLANTTNAIAEGEVQQLMNRNDASITEADYLAVIHYKTAKLFESAAEIGALLGSTNPEHHQAMANYGRHLGLAFQIIDDLLDYTANSDEMGKNVGDDLAEGKATLPLIYALHHADASKQKAISTAIQQGGLEHLDIVLQAIQETKAAAYCMAMAEQHAKQALDCCAFLPKSPYRTALTQLVHFAVQRNH